MDEKEDFRNEFAALAIAAGVEPRFADNYYDLIFELATGLVSRGDDLLIVGMSGAQGTGKSTFAKMLAAVFERVFEKTTLVMSLDDFYLTRAERETLAKDVHPMLRVRGVPGTHDIELLAQVIADLKTRRNTKVPVFDKGEDDRRGFVPVMAKNLDLLVIEGWCWGAAPQAEAELAESVNELEARLDAGGQWRRFVNEQLASAAYQRIFSEADVLFFMAAPDLETVRQWRWRQEEQTAGRGGSRVMSREEVDEFIMYFERLTLWMLRDLPQRATLTFFLDTRHQLVRPPKNMNSN